MRVDVGIYSCADCEKSFEAPLLNESQYGAFLLWSENGGVVYLNVFEDGAYKEVEGLIAALAPMRTKDSTFKTEVLQHIFGQLACDKDEHGAPYSIDGMPKCPFCGSGRIASWEAVSPRKEWPEDVPYVTHEQWNSLDEVARQLELERLLIY